MKKKTKTQHAKYKYGTAWIEVHVYISIYICMYLRQKKENVLTKKVISLFQLCRQLSTSLTVECFSKLDAYITHNAMLETTV